MPPGKGGALLGQFPFGSWSLGPAQGDSKVVIEHGRLASKALGRGGLQRTAHVVKSCRLAECEPGAAAEPERPRWQWKAELSGEFHRALGEGGRIRMLVGQKAGRGAVGQRLRQFGGGAEWLQRSQCAVRGIRVPAVTEPVKEHR